VTPFGAQMGKREKAISYCYKILFLFIKKNGKFSGSNHRGLLSVILQLT